MRGEAHCIFVQNADTAGNFEQVIFSEKYSRSVISCGETELPLLKLQSHRTSL